MPEQSGRPLAWHLAALCAALLSPALGLLAYLAVQEFAGDRARQEADARGAAGRVAITLDRGLTTLRATLEVLATSEYLNQRNFRAFRSRALLVPRSPRSAILVRDAAGNLVASTAEPPEAPSGEPETQAERQAARTREVAVSGLLASSSSGGPEFVVAVPVLAHDGQLDYVLSMTVPADALRPIFRGEALPGGMAASVLDADGLVLASSTDGDSVVGKRLLPGTELPPDTGWVQARNAEGTSVVAAAARSEVSGWAVVASLPEAAFTAGLGRSLLAAGGSAAALCLLALGLAFAFARRIARPIGALAGRAQPGSGEVAVLATPIREVNAVAHALAAAQAAAAAREQEREELLLTLDQAQVRVQDLEGRIQVWTTGCERLYGWTRAEAIGRVAHVLLHSEFPRPLVEIEAELHANDEWHGEIRNRRRDGRPVVAACQWALRRGADGEALAVVEACNDVTELRDLEAELRHSRDLLASVVNGSPEPIFVKDVQGRYVLLNPSAASILGVPPGSGAGRRTRDLVGPELAVTLDAADDSVIASGEPTTTEGEFLGRDGNRRVLLSTKAPWRDAEGRTVGVVAVSRDITLRRDAEARLHQTQAALFHVERRSAMGAMAAALSHELNQPLTAATNFAEAAVRFIRPDGADGDGVAAAREAIEAAAVQLLRVGKILRGMREFIGHADGERRPVVIDEVIERAVALARMGSRAERVAVRMRLISPAPLVLADRVQLEQVIVNLVRNAVEALEVAPRREIVISTERRDGEVEIRVADTGPGVSADVAALLFQPFVTTKRGGMGVGLSVSQSIVEQHGGTLRATPNPGGGTVFHFALPAFPPSEP